MAVTLIATPGAANSNSYSTLIDAVAYWETRLHPEAWDDSDDQTVALIMATRMIDLLLQPYKKLVRAESKFGSSERDYYLIRPTWTGSPSTAVQKLAWPRNGMYNRNGILIPNMVIPSELAEATAELAGQLSVSNRLEESDIVAQGITSVKAGSVAVTFKNDSKQIDVLPQVVLDMLVPTWLTPEGMEPVNYALFDVFSG